MKNNFDNTDNYNQGGNYNGGYRQGGRSGGRGGICQNLSFSLKRLR